LRAAGTSGIAGGFAAMAEDPLDHMRERIDRCRWLATLINDPRTNRALLEMAEQGEKDLRRLLAEREAREQPLSRPPNAT
jgi:hypothetical protein